MRTGIRSLAVFLLLAIAMLAQPARAASISFVPASPTTGLTQGDIVSLDVWFDFSDVVDASGTPVGTLGGGFDILWNPGVLSYYDLDYIAVGDPAFGRPPDVFDGILESWGLAAFDGLIGPYMLGTVHFEVIANASFSTVIRLAATNGLGGPWIHGGDFVTIIDVDYGSVTVTGVPLPAAGWLMLCALAGLVGLRKP